MGADPGALGLMVFAANSLDNTTLVEWKLKFLTSKFMFSELSCFDRFIWSAQGGQGVACLRHIVMGDNTIFASNHLHIGKQHLCDVLVIELMD